jgi:hypothetical protein
LQKLPTLLGASMLIGACGSVISTPPPPVPDAGPAPICPVGPNGPAAPASELPSGACQSDEGPCDYEATPCPSVLNGTVNGYLCTCQSAVWDCEVVNQQGLCTPISEDGGETDADLFPDVAFFDDVGTIGPTGPTGPNQP